MQITYEIPKSTVSVEKLDVTNARLRVALKLLASFQFQVPINKLDEWARKLDAQVPWYVHIINHIKGAVTVAVSDLKQVDMTPNSYLRKALEEWRVAILEGRRVGVNRDPNDPAHTELLWEAAFGTAFDASIIPSTNVVASTTTSESALDPDIRALLKRKKLPKDEADGMISKSLPADEYEPAENDSPATNPKQNKKGGRFMDANMKVGENE